MGCWESKNGSVRFDFERAFFLFLFFPILLPFFLVTFPFPLFFPLVQPPPLFFIFFFTIRSLTRQAACFYFVIMYVCVLVCIS